MVRKFGLAALMVCFLSAAALAADKTYVVATDATWPPMQMVNANKEVEGFECDFIRAVAKEVGITVEIRNIAWDGIFASLGTRQADIIASSVTITDKRKKALGLTEPFYAVRQAVIVPINVEVKTLAELDGKKIGGQIGTTGLIETLPKNKSKAEVKTYDEVALAIEDLVKGNIDAVICDDPIAKYYVHRKQEYSNQLRVAFVTEPPEYYGFAVRKDDKALLDALNKGIQLVKEKGIDKELALKWLGE